MSRVPFAQCFALLLAACEGPEGPQGLTGPTGLEGPRGPSGSPTLAAHFLGFNAQWCTYDGDRSAECSYETSDLTDEVMTNGAVLAYLGNATQTRWTAMPLTMAADSGSLFVGHSHEIGEVIFELRLDFTGDPRPYVDGAPIKLIIIPEMGTPPGKMAPDYSRYEEVARFYGLEQ